MYRIRTNGSLHVRVAQRTVGKILRWHHHPCGVRSLRRRIHRPPPTIPSLVASPMRGCTPLFADWTSLPVGHLRNAKINEIRSGGGRGSQHEASGVRDLSFVTLQPRLCTDSSTLTGKYLPWSLVARVKSRDQMIYGLEEYTMQIPISFIPLLILELLVARQNDFGIPRCQHVRRCVGRVPIIFGGFCGSVELGDWSELTFILYP